MTTEHIPGLVFEVYFEGECGMEAVTIEATNTADMMRQLRAMCPDDIGADGFYDDPITGEERPLNW